MSSASKKAVTLHILTDPDDALGCAMARRPPDAGGKPEVIDLTVPAPDYKALLEGIFAADTVRVW